MFILHGFRFSLNTTKVVYTAEALGHDYRYVNLDPAKGEHRTAEHLKRHFLGKTPTLTHGDNILFESGAICRYLASVKDSILYPVNDHYNRCLVDQWMDFFTAHLGRWVATVYFENHLKSAIGLGEPNTEQVKEAQGFFEEQIAALNGHLKENTYLTGKRQSIADVFAFSYLEAAEASSLPLKNYEHVDDWYQQLKRSDFVARSKQRLELP